MFKTSNQSQDLDEANILGKPLQPTTSFSIYIGDKVTLPALPCGRPLQQTTVVAT